jgi:hypothetical protein
VDEPPWYVSAGCRRTGITQGFRNLAVNTDGAERARRLHLVQPRGPGLRRAWKSARAYKAPASLALKQRRLAVVRGAQNLTGPEYGAFHPVLPAQRSKRVQVICSSHSGRSSSLPLLASV